MINFLLIALPVLNIVCLIVMFIIQHDHNRNIWYKYAILQEDMAKLNKNVFTAGKVLQIMEEEMKILEKRRAEAPAVQRPTRNLR